MKRARPPKQQSVCRECVSGRLAMGKPETEYERANHGGVWVWHQFRKGSTDTICQEIKRHKCSMYHHEEYGQPMPWCAKHSVAYVCGPFNHGCPECSPGRCMVCRQLRLLCSC